MGKYKMIQITNKAIGAQTVGAFLPLGLITRKIDCGNSCGNAFSLTASGADTVVVNESGYHRVTYTATLLAAAATALTVTLLVNGTESMSATVLPSAAGAVPVTVDFFVRVFPNCGSASTNIPAYLQMQLSSTAITGGNSNLIIERLAV